MREMKKMEQEKKNTGIKISLHLARRPQLPLPDPLQLRIHPLPHSCYPVMLQTPSSRLSAIRDLMVQQGRDAFVSCHARP